MGRRIGILGGTFDPIHLGHLIVGQEVLDRCNLEMLIFLPSGEPPHKQYPEMASAESRLEMVKLAIAESPWFDVSLVEVDRPGKSYTVETLRILRQDLGEDTEILLAIGADNAVDMPTWLEPESVLKLSQVIVLARPGFNQSRVDPFLAEQMEFFETPLFDISSSDIRARVRSGRPIHYLVPPRVEDYIRKQDLYR